MSDNIPVYRGVSMLYIASCCECAMFMKDAKKPHKISYKDRKLIVYKEVPSLRTLYAVRVKDIATKLNEKASLQDDFKGYIEVHLTPDKNNLRDTCFNRDYKCDTEENNAMEKKMIIFVLGAGVFGKKGIVIGS